MRAQGTGRRAQGLLRQLADSEDKAWCTEHGAVKDLVPLGGVRRIAVNLVG